MTLDDLFSRVIRSHLLLIIVITLLPVGLVLALGELQPTEWRASVRIQATSAVPTSSTEAEGLSSRILAIATTPTVVSDSLRAAGVDGNAVDVSEKHVTAQRLGESPVVELSVTNPTKAHADALVKQLSIRVLKFMNTADRGRFEAAVEDVNQRLDDTRTQRDRLAERLATMPPGQARNHLQDLANEASKVAAELSSQRASLIMADITRGRAVLVDGQTPTVLIVPSSLLPRLGLALVLGLCLAIATAAAIETFRPKVPDARSLARVLDAPMLATVKQAPGSLAHSLSLVARRNGLDTVVILPADPAHRASASALARSLSRTHAQRERVRDRVLVDGSGDDGTEVDRDWGTAFVDLPSLAHRQEVSAGVAVVCAGPVPHEHIESLHDVLRATHWPLIGVLDAGSAWTAEKPDVWSSGEAVS